MASELASPYFPSHSFLAIVRSGWSTRAAEIRGLSLAYDGSPKPYSNPSFLSESLG